MDDAHGKLAPIVKTNWETIRNLKNFRPIAGILNLRGTNKVSQANLSKGNFGPGKLSFDYCREGHKLLDCHKSKMCVFVAPYLGLISNLK
jgi:hypothetical protein